MLAALLLLSVTGWRGEAFVGYFVAVVAGGKGYAWLCYAMRCLSFFGTPTIVLLLYARYIYIIHNIYTTYMH